MIVRICHLDRGFSTFCWLCPGCLSKRKAAGWTVKGKPKDPPHAGLTCDDCHAVGEMPSPADTTTAATA